MAQVPYSPTPSVQPSGQALPNLNVTGVTSDAFGGQSAAALGNLGKQLERTGDEIFQRAVALQTLQNEAEAQDANARFVEGMSELHAAYQSTQGMEAVNGRQPYLDSLNKLRDETGVGLNPAARRLYDNMTRQQYSRAAFNASGHAATEFKKFTIGGVNAKIKANEQSAVLMPNEDNFDEAVTENERLIRGTRAIVGGMSDEQADQLVNDSTSRMYLAKITGMVREDPFAANEFLERNRGKLTNPADLEKAENLVQNKTYTLGARRTAAQINAEGRADRGLSERVTEAEATAERQRPGDKLYAEYVKSAVISGYQTKKKITADDLQYNAANVSSAINGDFGKVPTSPEELMATSPEIAASWQAIPATKRGPYLSAMARAAKGDVGETESTFREYLKLRGQATSDNAEDRRAFLEHNAADWIGKLPQKRITELLKMQETIYKGGGLAGKVTEGMRILTSAGIAPTLAGTNADTVNTFRGALQEATDVFYQENKRLPKTLDEWKQIGTQINQQYPDPNTFSSRWFSTKYPLWQHTVPSEVKEGMDKGAGTELTDEQARRALFRKRYKELYGGSVSKPPAAQNPRQGPQ